MWLLSQPCAVLCVLCAAQEGTTVSSKGGGWLRACCIPGTVLGSGLDLWLVILPVRKLPREVMHVEFTQWVSSRGGSRTWMSGSREWWQLIGQSQHPATFWQVVLTVRTEDFSLSVNLNKWENFSLFLWFPSLLYLLSPYPQFTVVLPHSFGTYHTVKIFPRQLIFSPSPYPILLLF